MVSSRQWLSTAKWMRPTIQLIQVRRSVDASKHPARSVTTLGWCLKPVIYDGIKSTTKPQLVNCLAGISSMLWLVSPLVSFWVSMETTLSVGFVMERLRPFGCWPDSRHELLGWRHAMEIRLPETSIISIISPWKSMFGRWVSLLEQCLLTGAYVRFKGGGNLWKRTGLMPFWGTLFVHQTRERNLPMPRFICWDWDVTMSPTKRS